MHANSDENSFWRVCPKSSSEQSGYTINVFVSTFSPGRRRNKNKQTNLSDRVRLFEWIFGLVVRKNQNRLNAQTVRTNTCEFWLGFRWHCNHSHNKTDFCFVFDFGRIRQNEFSSEFACIVTLALLAQVGVSRLNLITENITHRNNIKYSLW